MGPTEGNSVLFRQLVVRPNVPFAPRRAAVLGLCPVIGAIEAIAAVVRIGIELRDEHAGGVWVCEIKGVAAVAGDARSCGPGRSALSECCRWSRPASGSFAYISGYGCRIGIQEIKPRSYICAEVARLFRGRRYA